MHVFDVANKLTKFLSYSDDNARVNEHPPYLVKILKIQLSKTLISTSYMYMYVLQSQNLQHNAKQTHAVHV